jgi:hypothetical protein
MDSESFILDRDLELHPTNNIETERIRMSHLGWRNSPSPMS